MLYCAINEAYTEYDKDDKDNKYNNRSNINAIDNAKGKYFNLSRELKNFDNFNDLHHSHDFDEIKHKNFYGNIDSKIKPAYFTTQGQYKYNGEGMTINELNKLYTQNNQIPSPKPNNMDNMGNMGNMGGVDDVIDVDSADELIKLDSEYSEDSDLSLSSLCNSNDLHGINSKNTNKSTRNNKKGISTQDDRPQKFKLSHEYCIDKMINDIIDNTDDISHMGSQNCTVYKHVRMCKYCKGEINKRLQQYFNKKNVSTTPAKIKYNPEFFGNKDAIYGIKDILFAVLLCIIFIFMIDFFIRIHQKLKQ